MKVLKIIGNVAKYVLLILLLVTLISVVSARFLGKEPEIFGHQINVIVTPSMEPELMVGDMIISRSYNGESLKQGDIITYLCPEGPMKGKLITHKIIEISHDGETIITQGIANANPDEPINKSDVRSVLVYKTFILKYIYRLTTNVWGFLLLVIVPLVYMIISEIYKIVIETKKEGKNEEI